MDQLRDEVPHADDRDEPNQEPPPALGQPERRMQARAYTFWAGMLRGRSLPSIFDCDPDRARDFEANSVLLDVSGGTDNPAVRSLGAKLAEECGITSLIARLSDVPADSLLAAIADHAGQSLASRAPFGFESELVNQRGAMILYRGILLPFSSDERSVDFLVCAVNWKEVADPALVEALHSEIHRALGREPLLPRRDEPLTEWADGPAADGGMPGFVPSESEPGLVMTPQDGDHLEELLDAARALDAEACLAEWRAREARAKAVGAAFDLSLAAARAPAEFAALQGGSVPEVSQGHAVSASGAPPPPTVVARLVLGAGAGRPAIANYAAALAHGHRLGLGRGDLPAYLARTAGGLDAVTAAERQLRRERSGKRT